MHIKKSFIVSLLSISMLTPLASCGLFDEASVPSSDQGGREKQSKEDVIRIKEIAGRWKSQLAPLPGMEDQWFSIDISNNKKIALETRSRGVKFDIIYGSVTGDYELTKDGIKVSNLDNTTGTMKGVTQLPIKIISPSEIEITLKEGKVILQYTGS